jgi:hypothetical protein
MSKSVDEQIRKVARANVGDGPAGHTKGCMCGECVKHKARIEDEAERIAQSVVAGVREVNQADAEHEQYVAGRRVLGEAREVAAGGQMVRTKLQASMEGHLRRAAELVEQAGDERMGDEQYRQFTRATTRAAELAEQRAVLQGLEDRAYKVVSEARVYGPESRASYFEDLLLAQDFDPMVSGPARERRARYATELAYEARRGSPEGRRVLRAIKEHHRQERVDLHREAESRAIGTDGGISAAAAGEAASFVSPYFIELEWAPYRGKARSFADQCHQYPMPPYGLKVYVPYFSSAASASEQTEGAAVSESSPTAALQGATVETVSGQVVVSAQLRDRALTGGGAFDLVIGRQIHQQLDQELDLYVLNQAIANGRSVSGQSTYKTANLYADIALAREELTDTAGTRLRPTHLFTTSDLYSYATRQVDATTERPIVQPWFAPGFPISNGADGGPQDGGLPKWSRFTGTVMPGGLLWFTDDSIPTFGTTSQTQLVVSAPDEAITLCESEPILTSFPETDAAHLQVVVNLREYVVAVTRHQSGTAAITSAAYKASLV